MFIYLLAMNSSSVSLPMLFFAGLFRPLNRFF